MSSKAWERRDKESTQAFEAFMRYLGQKPTERSTRLVGEALGKSTGLIERWCTANDWKDRARSWDGENERKIMAVEQKRQVDRVVSMRTRHRKLGRRALELAMKALARDELADSMTLADVYRLMRGGLLLEESGFEQAIPQSVATSGDLTDPMKQGNTQANQQATTMLRKLEIEVIGEGGKIVPASEIAATLASFYDKPEAK